MKDNHSSVPIPKEKNNETTSEKYSRRTFLKNTGIACVLLFGFGGAATFAKGKMILRPPGGQDEDSLLSLCLRCDRCRSVCPTSAITFARVTDGFLEARTPTMDYHAGYCDFCNKCVEVCPTEALKPFNPDSVKIGKAVVQKDICIAWATGACTICAEKCPYDAISLDAHNRPIVDEQKCNGCGVCEYECPALVLRSYIGGNVRGIVVKASHHRSRKRKGSIDSSLGGGGDFE